MTANEDELRQIVHLHLRSMPCVGAKKADKLIDAMGGPAALVEAMDTKPANTIVAAGVLPKTAARIARRWKQTRERLAELMEAFTPVRGRQE